MPAGEATKGAPGLAGTWLAAPVPEGLVLVGERVALDVPLPGAAGAGERLAPVLAAGGELAELAEAGGIEPDQAGELAGRLADLAEPATAEAAASTGFTALGAALAGAHAPRGDDAVPFGVIATADEVLLHPLDLESESLRTLLRDFVAGLRPVQRRRAYCYAIAAGRRTVVGDRPAATALATALEGADRRDPGAVHVIDLRGATELELPVAEIGAVGARHPHRLGTVLRLAPLGRPAVAELGLVVAVADHALADPGRVEPPTASQQTKGVARDLRTAELIARAEAAERCAAGDRTAVELRRATIAELDRPVSPASLFAPNARQLERDTRLGAFDPGRPRTWAAARGLDGERSWVPAEAVLCPFDDGLGTGHVVLGTSSGLAAGPTVQLAVRSALAELVERDAFLWTWAQGISRELIAHHSLPAELRDSIAALEATGLAVELANLTLETDPVLLCGVRGEQSLTVGAGCSPDPARAAATAFCEAAVTRLGVDPPAQPVRAQDVHTPADHEALYRLGSAADRAGFLFASGDRIALAEVAGSGLEIERAIAELGDPVGEPLIVDLTTPRTAPFCVVRALVPGLIPICFGFDTEPLGMPLLAAPRRAADGRILGGRLDLGEVGPWTPHPFA